MMTSIETPTINLLDPRFYVDPFDAYRWLRDNSPVHWDPIQKLWGISRHADVIDVEKHAKRYTSNHGSRPRTDQTSDTSMINQDDPAHQSQRMVVARQFTPRAVKVIEESIRSVVTGLIDDVIEAGECEAVDTLASRLPAIVIGDKLGYPRDMWTKVREWSEVTMNQAGQTPADGVYLQPDGEGGGYGVTGAIADFGMRTMEIIAHRRADPQDDLISKWAHTEINGRYWSDGEILSECLLLLDGGAETTRTVIGAALYELTQRTDQKELLLADPSILADTAVEEFIRWVTPILNMRRTATEDHEYHGQSIRAGDELLLMYSSANRDERVYTDPDRLDVSRQHNNHVAFGFGTHFCLGASLARIEIRVMFEELLRRMPDFRLAPGTQPQIIPATFTRAYDAVHLEFTPGVREG
jgi:cytochrome P450 family 142 subfamily A polypeptide 1